MFRYLCVNILVQLVEERRKDLKALIVRKNELAQTRDQLREQMENRRQEIHEGRAALATQLNNFYESFFPQLDSPARYLLAYFEAGAGCLVCGTQTPEATERVTSKLYMNTCPVCGSPIEEGHRPANDPHAGEEIEQQREGIAAAEADLAAMEQPLRGAEQGYSSTAAELVSITSQLASLEGQLKALAETLKRRLGKSVTLTEHVDPSLIGGLVVKVGSQMIDSSLKTKLSAMKIAMKEVG